MALIKTLRGIFEVFDASGKISGYELEHSIVYEPDGDNDPLVGMVQPCIRREAVSAETVLALRERAHDTLVAEHAALNLQIAEERETHAAAMAEKDAVIASKRAELAALRQ